MGIISCKSDIMDNYSYECVLSLPEYAVGSIYFGISLLFLLPYTIVLYVIVNDKSLLKQQYYKIVVHIAIADIVQLLFNGVVAGVFTYLCFDMNKSPIYFWINKIFGGLMNSCWIAYTALAHVLALNRFCNMFYKAQIDFIFSKRNTQIMLTISWTYGFGWFIAFMCPDFNMLYFLWEYKWDYDMTPLSQKAWRAEVYSDSINACSMIVWYSLILIKLRSKVKSIQSGVIAQTSKKENKVLLQAMLLCSMVLFVIIGFFFIPYITTSKVVNVVTGLIWIVCAGNNALICICLNSTIRKKFIIYMRRMVKRASVTPISVATSIVAGVVTSRFTLK